MLELAAGTPVKQKLLRDLRAAADDRGRVNVTFDELRKRFGLNGHDAFKNLDQLRKEGLITYVVKDSRIQQINVVRRRPTPLKDRIVSWILSQPGADLGAWVGTTPAVLRERLGAGDAVNVEVSRLITAGRLEARKDGQRIVALRVPLRGPGRRPPTTATTPIEARDRDGESTPLRAPVMPATPELDAYVAARRIARLAPERNPYLSVVFEDNPLAEEALTLRQTLAELLEKNQ